MNSYSKTGRYSFERKDCSVIALSYGIGIDYEKAHEICKKHGRKDNKGFCLRQVFRVSIYKKSRQFMGRRISYFTNQHITLERFARLHPTGNYIICVSNHYCTLVEGKVLNQSNKNVRVKYYFRISKPTKIVDV